MKRPVQYQKQRIPDARTCTNGIQIEQFKRFERQYRGTNWKSCKLECHSEKTIRTNMNAKHKHTQKHVHVIS